MRGREEKQSIQHVWHVQRAWPSFPPLLAYKEWFTPLSHIQQFCNFASKLLHFPIKHKGSHAINKRPILRNDFPFLLPNHCQESSGNGWVARLKGSALGTHLPRGCGRRFGPSWASGFNLGPQRSLALTQQEPPLTLAPGTTLGIAPTGWRVRDTFALIKGSILLRLAKETPDWAVPADAWERIYENAGPPTTHSLTLWTLSASTSSTALCSSEHQLSPHFSLDTVSTQTFLNVSLIPQIHILKYLSIVNAFVYPFCQILFLTDTCPWNIFFSLKHHLWKSDYSNNRKQTYSTCLRGKWSLELVVKDPEVRR